MSRIFWDTNLFIYLFEDHGARANRVAALLARMRERDDELVTSMLTLGELLVRPLAAGDNQLAERYQSVLSSNTTLIAFDRTCVLPFARVRNDRTLKAPDAIQLACAAAAGVDLFITNDDRLAKKVIPGIQFIVSLDRAPL
jgi:predicted nucleic acid-binding protein